MKITDIKLTELKGLGPIKLAGGLAETYYPFVLMSVETDVGITGYSFNWFWPMDRMIDGLGRLKAAAIGRDPFDVQKLTMALTGNLLLPDVAISVFDIALWDIMGKAVNQPVYNLLGGKVKAGIQAYATTPSYNTVQEYIEMCQWAIDHNFRCYKVHSSPDPEMDIEICRKLREKYPHMKLAIDACGYYNMHDALKVGKEIEKLDFEWYESPVPDDDYEGLKRLQRLINVPIEFGENIYNIGRGVTDIMKQRPGEVMRTFGDFWGGITMLSRVAYCADAFNMKFDPHSFGPITVQAANLHVMLAHESSWWFELPIQYDIFNVCTKDTLLPGEDGLVRPTGKSGLGVDIDLDELEKRTIATA